MKLHMYVGGIASTNGYVLETGEKSLIVLDAAHGITDWIRKKFPDHIVTHLLLTHLHFDHVMDAQELKSVYGCQIIANRAYDEDLTLVKGVQRSWGIDLSLTEFKVDEILGDTSQSKTWGGLMWKMAHVPGHSYDSEIFYLPDEGIVFTGDTIFAGSIGRTDLLGGDVTLLVSKVKEHVLSLPDETVILPGHGGESTVKQEKDSNPFLS